MKIQAYKIDNFIKEEATKLDSSLLYGPDQGLALERKQKFIELILGKDYDPMLLVELDSDNITKDPNIFLMEINAMSLLGGDKLIIVNNASNNFTKILEQGLAEKKTDHYILVIAKELATSSSLRKLYEAGKNIAALPCYVDDLAAIITLVNSELRELNLSSEVREFIANNLAGDRMLIRNELEKIKLFASSGNNVDLEAINYLLAINNDFDFQNLANAVASRNADASLKILEDLLNQGFPAITLIRVLNNYLYRLLEVKTALTTGQNFEQAIKTLRPPVFFKQKDLLRNHVNLWHEKQLKNLIEKLTEVEILCKTHSQINTSIFLKFFTLIITIRR